MSFFQAKPISQQENHISVAQNLINQYTRLQALHKDKQKTVTNPVSETLGQLEIIDRSLKVGDRVPDFSLPNATGKTVRLQELLTQGPVVLTFHRGQFCPYDNLDLWALQQTLPSLTVLGATLLTLSSQPSEEILSLLENPENPEMTFEVLHDEDNQVARTFGLVCQLPTSLRSTYERFGIEVSTASDEETFELLIHAVYVIAPDGTIIYAFVDPGYTRRLDPGKCLMALDEEYWLALV